MNPTASRIDIIASQYPPAQDAIGAYTKCLATELSKLNIVRVLTNVLAKRETTPSLSIVPCITSGLFDKYHGLLGTIVETPPDFIVLQYNPFSWGKRGWAPDLVVAFRKLRKLLPNATLAVMFHEIYMMNPGWRSWVMRIYQKWQFQQLSRCANVNFFSTETWLHLSAEHRPAVHLPVGSNLPLNTESLDKARKRLGINRNAFVCGVFGGRHPSRMIDWIELAYKRIKETRGAMGEVKLLHVGGEKLPWSTNIPDLLETGWLSDHDAASALACVDLLVNPFVDGVSTRRGSVMAALQHGVPVLTTRGRSTDAIWQKSSPFVEMADPTSLSEWHSATDRLVARCLTDSSNLRLAAMEYYQKNFDWSVVAMQTMRSLQSVQKSTPYN